MSLSWLAPSEKRIMLGTYGHFPLKRALRLPLSKLLTHFHVIGISGSGKSRYLAHLYLSLLRAGHSATLIDPHGDLARLILSQLVSDGVYRESQAYERIVYLDLPAAQRAGKYLPLNILAQNLSPHTLASHVMDAMHRAWSSLAGGNAATFDTLIQNGVKVLVSNRLPLVRLYHMLSDRPYREQLLAHEDDPDVVSVFHNWYDKLSARDQADQAGATLRRMNLLAFDPVLKHSLGQEQMLLNFRELLDTNRSVIVNLKVENPEAMRLLGCLLTVSAEQGALSRGDLPPGQRFNTHHLIIDEFANFTAQSEAALSDMLSQTRKFGLYLVLAHQTWGQAGRRLQAALQNTGIRVVFNLGREDAEYFAPIVGKVDPLSVKHEVADEHAVERTHPSYFSLPEQWEEWVEELTDLDRSHAFITYRVHKRHYVPFHQSTRRVVKVKTPKVEDPRVDVGQLAEVEQEYLTRYFREPSPGLNRYQPPAPATPLGTTRIEPDERTPVPTISQELGFAPTGVVWARHEDDDASPELKEGKQS